jgi:hypothetical protein
MNDEMAASAEPPVLEPRPKRVQLNTQVSVRAKQRLLRLVARQRDTGKPLNTMTKLLEHAAAAWEAATVAHIKTDPLSRFRGAEAEVGAALYLDGRLTAEGAFRGGHLRNRKTDPNEPRVALSVMMLPAARQALVRYGDFYGIPVHTALDLFSKNIGKRFPDPDPGEAHPMESGMALDPALAPLLEAEAEQPEPLPQAAE